MDLELHYSADSTWAALYADGALVQVGEAAPAEEKAFELTGVVQVHDEAFLRGQTSRDGVAPSLADVAAYRHQRDRAKNDADALRRMAQRILDEADALENGTAAPR
jgi:hypothetical protein